ncbi:GNAT family N-acetyltransferase [Tumebacillus flagellatus]|uniref:GNAT family N-acetyltransferase n=1 Tax=Tumebacillus flagellatus TaxID=1157490 RepID=UPI001EE66A8C|nr:GNAT family N-acetyltransferase [Tumebacillus flagellatus]
MAKQSLTPEELTEIRELVEVCNNLEGIQLKMNWDMLKERKGDQTDDFLYCEDGRLLGYFALFAIQSTEAEMIAAVHPDARCKGIFRQLFHAAYEQLKQRTIPKLLFVVDNKSESATAVAKHYGGQYQHSEYGMKLQTAKIQPKRHDNLLVRRATVADAQFCAQVASDAFGYPIRPAKDASFFELPTRRTYVFCLGEERIGTMQVVLYPETQGAGIYGFCVDKHHQGKGYGRQVLSEVVQELLQDGYPNVELEVACENKNALGLYQSIGFEEIGAIDYYAISVQ